MSAANLAGDREVLLGVLSRVEALHAPVTVCQDFAHPTSPVCTGARYSRESHTLSVVCAACCTDGAGPQQKTASILSVWTVFSENLFRWGRGGGGEPEPTIPAQLREQLAHLIHDYEES